MIGNRKMPDFPSSFLPQLDVGSRKGDDADRDMELLMSGFGALNRQPIVRGHSAHGAEGLVEFVAIRD